MSNATFQIICIQRNQQPNDCRSITWVGTSDGQGFSVRDVILLIRTGTTFFVRDERGETATVRPANREGHEYIRTRADDTPDDNLLRLPQCPSTYRQ